MTTEQVIAALVEKFPDISTDSVSRGLDIIYSLQHFPEDYNDGDYSVEELTDDLREMMYALEAILDVVIPGYILG